MSSTPTTIIMSSKPAPKFLTLEQKLEVIKKLDKGQSARSLAKEYGVGKTQVGNISKRKADILAEENKASPKKKLCLRKTGNEDINDVTQAWVIDAVSRKIEVSGPMIQAKALEVAKDLNCDSFKASNGWLQSFVKRNELAFGKISGESGDVDPVVADDWKSRLPELCRGYAPRDRFNMDETGLYYRTTQDKSYYEKQSKPGGGKKSKERVTLALAANSVGEKEPPLVIGKSANPRAFKRLPRDKLPVIYENSKKAWMNTPIFLRWLNNFNLRMKKQKRHVLLFIDNAPSHKCEQLSNVKVIFLPANTTSVLQPLDQGVIQATKLQYRRLQYQHIMAEMKGNNKTGLEIMKSVTLLNAVTWIKQAWDDVKPETIQKCFARCGFPMHQDTAQESDDVDAFDVFVEETVDDVIDDEESYRLYFPQDDEESTEHEHDDTEFDALSLEFTGQTFNNLHTLEACLQTDEVCHDWTLPHTEILKQIQDKRVSDDEDEDNVTPSHTPLTTDAQLFAALSTLKKGCEERGLIQQLRLLGQLNTPLLQSCVADTTRKQPTIDTFFNPL